jgi:hypothetical protein
MFPLHYCVDNPGWWRQEEYPAMSHSPGGNPINILRVSDLNATEKGSSDQKNATDATRKMVGLTRF